MFRKRYNLEQLKKKVKAMENYLAQRPGFEGFGDWPDPDSSDYWSLRWIMEYCMLLKGRYYRGFKRGK